MDDNRLSRVEILFQQKKYAEAERILKDLLTEDANNIHFLSLFAEVNLEQDKYDLARKVIDNAIGLSPDTAHLFYIKSRISILQDDYSEGEKNIKQSIALNPYNANYFAMLAHIKLVRKQYEDALTFSNKALEIDAENLLGLNIRSSALLKLNNSDESFFTIEGALREDPNNAYTHANYGWGLLEKGKHTKALEHFKESLKNDPNFEYAQAGMMEALKAKNPIYRLFLQYTFWMSKLTAKYQWTIIVGFYLIVRVLNRTAQTNEILAPYLTPLVIVLVIIALSTWIINPISNLFLRFNTYGQLLLDKKAKMSSNFVAAALLTFVISFLLYFILADEKFLIVAVFGFAMMVPFGTMFSPSKYKHALLIYAVTMSVIGLSAIGLTFLTGKLFNFFALIFAVGFVGFQWIANYLLIKENNK